MRIKLALIGLFCVSTAFANAGPALAASSSAAPGGEVRVLALAMVTAAGLPDLVESYTKETGKPVMAASGSVAAVMGDKAGGDGKTPPVDAPDIVAVPRELMDTLEKNGGLLKGSRRPLGRLEIGLLVRSGAPHPDISTVAKLAAVLKGADSLVYSNPARGSIVGAMAAALLQRPAFKGVKGFGSSKGDGVDALSRGEAQMAFQLTCEVPPAHPVENVELVGNLPPELNMHIDIDVAVVAQSRRGDDALAFIRYITRPAAAPLWKAKALSLQ